MPGGQILLLGPPQVLAGGQLVNIERRISRGILYFLASIDHPVTRSELLTYFWRETPEKNAHARLSEVLSRLNTLLPGFLLKDTRQVSINNDLVYIDQSQFKNLVAEIGDHPWKTPRDHPLPSIFVNKMVEAASLWRGMHYLGGKVLSYSVELEDWFYLTSHQLESQHVRLLLRLAENYLVYKAYEECQSIIQKALLIDRLNREIYNCLLNCLLDQRKVIEAREQYKQMVTTFQKEGYLDLPASLEEFQTGFQASTPPSTLNDPKLVWNLKNNLVIPFVGRKGPLERLHQAFLTGGEIIILGESGLGKTRLIQEFLNQLNPQPRMYLMNCRSGEESLPYQPIIDYLRRYVSPEVWKALPSIWVDHLSLLLPEITEYIGGDIYQPVKLASDTPATLAQARLMEAIRQVSILFDTPQQMVFCLDDAQWADEATLDTIKYLSTRPPFHRHLKIIIARSDKISPVVQRLIDQLLKQPSCQLLELAYLDQNEVGEFFTLATGRMASQDLITQLAQSSGGNPLYLVEILHLLQENQDNDARFNLNHIPLGASIRSLILSRLESVSSTAREILQTASIVGVEFSADMIAGIQHQNLDIILPSIEELQSHQLIELIPESSGKIRCQFIHSAIREILLQEISPIRRQKFEQAVANRLEAHQLMGDSSQAAILAQHYEQAGEGVRAFEKWVQAGQYARMLFSIKGAEYAFERAENLISLLPELPDKDIYDLYTEWTEVFNESEDANSVENLSKKLERISKERENIFLLGTALNIRCQAFTIRNQIETGYAVSEYTLQLLQNEPVNINVIDALCHRGSFLMMQGRFKHALSSFEKALILVQNASSRAERRARATALYNLAILQSYLGLPILALQNAQIALDENIELNNPSGLVNAYTALVWANYFLGKIDQARQFCGLGLELATRIQAFRALGYLHVAHAMIDFEYGELDSAFDHTEEAIKNGEKYQHADIISAGYRIKGDLFAVLGSEEALFLLKTSRSIGKDGYMDLGTIVHLGFTNYLNGNKIEGLAQILEGMHKAEIAGLEIIAFHAKTGYLQTLFLENHFDLIISMAEDLILVSRGRGIKSIELYSSYILGACLLKSGQLLPAIDCLTSVLEQCEKVPYVWLAIESMVTLHDAFQQIGNSNNPIPQKLHKYLERLESNINKPGLKEAFETYKDEKLTHVI